MNKQNVITENCIQNFMKEKYSCFLENRGYFGNYPSQSDINTMEKIGIHYFINLTCQLNANLCIIDGGIPIPRLNCGTPK